MTYIAIALTVLVITQVIRLYQNFRQLEHLKASDEMTKRHSKQLDQMKEDFDAVLRNEIDR